MISKDDGGLTLLKEMSNNKYETDKDNINDNDIGEKDCIYLMNLKQHYHLQTNVYYHTNA